MSPGPHHERGRCRPKFGSRIGGAGVQSVGAARPSPGHSSFPPRLGRFAFPFNKTNARAKEKLAVISRLPYRADTDRAEELIPLPVWCVACCKPHATKCKAPFVNYRVAL